MRTPLAPVLLAVVTGLALTACGSDDDGGAPAEAASSAAVGSPGGSAPAEAPASRAASASPRPPAEAKAALEFCQAALEGVDASAFAKAASERDTKALAGFYHQLGESLGAAKVPQGMTPDERAGLALTVKVYRGITPGQVDRLLATGGDATSLGALGLSKAEVAKAKAFSDYSASACVAGSGGTAP